MLLIFLRLISRLRLSIQNYIHKYFLFPGTLHRQNNCPGNSAAYNQGEGVFKKKNEIFMSFMGEINEKTKASLLAEKFQLFSFISFMIFVGPMNLI